MAKLLNFFVSLFEELFTREKASSKPVLFSQRPFSMLLFPFFIPESSVFHLDVYSTLHRKTHTNSLRNHIDKIIVKLQNHQNKVAHKVAHRAQVLSTP